MTDDVLHRTDGSDPSAEATRKRVREWTEATDRLCRVADFREWLYSLMDDFGLFDAPETEISAFRQGIRAAAHRIRNRMLEADGAVDLFADFAKRHHSELRKRLEEARNTNRKD